MTVVVASNNPNKIREIKAILAPLGWEVLSQKEAGVHVDPEENGLTFEENSAIKARAVMEESGLSAVADDSGIEVDALCGAPGVHSARYGGDACPDDSARNELLLRNMESVPDGERDARFVSVITMIRPDGSAVSARGELPGKILRQAEGDGGFGYDPLFYIPAEGCTMAQLSPERKNQISHRAEALRRFVEKLMKENEHADK
ncbi:MAG: RdgB/HAM1 family non-canonical purine NTP pyrophosphatase [Oscillospiraceae bacterium]|nr:RdgB/HAM1 family non-canonical purine NTP pyrophosphatase [Oscillospiraceae bacterium]